MSNFEVSLACFYFFFYKMKFDRLTFDQSNYRKWLKFEQLTEKMWNWSTKTNIVI